MSITSSPDGRLAAPAPLDSALFESSPDCVKLLNLGGRIVAMNRNGQCAMEIDDFSAIADHPWSSLWPAESRHMVETAMASAVHGSTGRFSAFCPTARGLPRWWDVVVSPVWNEAGEVTSMMALSRNVSAIHDANAQLLASGERLHKIIHQAATGVVESDVHGVITLVNAKFCDMLGYTEAEMLGANVVDFTAPAFQSETAGLVRQIATDCQPAVMEKQYCRKDGTLLWATSSVSALRLPDGSVEGLVAVIVDITERKQAESRLREADQRKDEFLAMLAHELRNPLAPIAAAAQLIGSSRLSEQAVRSTSDVIVRQVNHMTSLVDDLLDVSRVTRGLVELERAPIDILSVIADAVEQIAPLMDARHHKLAVVPSDEAATVLGDKKRLVQVVANLLNNAAKYTNEGGVITLRTSVQDDCVAISVTDNGIGMETELSARVFDLFTQARRTPDRASGGLGLGLALVRSLVELHGGSVTCASDGAGRGSCFSLTLPRIAHGHKAEPVAIAATIDLTSRALRVMIVDDNQDAADMLAMLLEASGHQVLINYSALKALEDAGSDVADVFLIDIGLPDMDGKQLVRQLREGGPNAGKLMVAISGYGQASDSNNALAAGFDHYLVKPVQFGDLSAILARH